MEFLAACENHFPKLTFGESTSVDQGIPQIQASFGHKY